MDQTLHIVTRRIYQKQHNRLVGDADAFDRLYGLVEGNSFGIDPNWFKGKQAIDIGCGNVGTLMLRLAELGVAKILGVDVGSDWIPDLRRALENRLPTELVVELVSGNVLSVPAKDATYDFVAIDGVLIHLENMAEVVRGFNEGARVCKSGGYLYTTYGPCQGLVQGAIFPAIRKYYEENPKFRHFIDELTPKKLYSIIDKICLDAKTYANQDLNSDWLKSLFGEDFCVFLQNYIQAPRWLSNECTPELVKELYRANGFTNVQRLNQFVKRKDVRKYFAPLHFDQEYEVSQVLYGKGFVQFIGQKPGV